jgi:Flp pilus assembly protein TadG
VRQRLSALRGCDRGQALVELALVIPLLLFVVFCIIDFGLAINTENSDDNLANLAVREAAVVGTASSVTCSGSAESTLTAWVDCEATHTAPGLGTPSAVCVGDTSTATPNSNFTAGDPVEVEITVPFNWLGVITGGVNSSLKVGSLSSVSSIKQSATMRLEQGASGSTFLTPICSS